MGRIGTSTCVRIRPKLDPCRCLVYVALIDAQRHAPAATVALIDPLTADVAPAVGTDHGASRRRSRSPSKAEHLNACRASALSRPCWHSTCSLPAKTHDAYCGAVMTVEHARTSGRHLTQGRSARSSGRWPHHASPVTLSCQTLLTDKHLRARWFGVVA